MDYNIIFSIPAVAIGSGIIASIIYIILFGAFKH